MKVAVLTSSRADYGIYLPLLKKMEKDSFFELQLIVFGTHLSYFHGHTIDNIIEDGFHISERLETLILGDSETAIANAIGNTITRFSSLWEKVIQDIDVVITLGDRYEMFAAVAASIPFNIPIAHIHGGETTLGAIDNKFRHAITIMSSIHFASTKLYCEKISQLIGSTNNIYNVGALSLDNLLGIKLMTKDFFKAKFNIDLSKPTVLTTFHPETVSIDRNREYAETLVNVFESLSKCFQIVITMPNADTMGNIIRAAFLELSEKNSEVICVENFGMLGYFSCMEHCSFLLGNTSSGIIEAASLGCYVINVGDRQKGRVKSNNVIDTKVDFNEILGAVTEINGKSYEGNNIYHLGNSSDIIVDVLKKSYEK
jgi:GDP/UDP-N,N'-diacetylbacillosamine 2-epimerase (hydrolysing)